MHRQGGGHALAAARHADRRQEAVLLAVEPGAEERRPAGDVKHAAEGHSQVDVVSRQHEDFLGLRRLVDGLHVQPEPGERVGRQEFACFAHPGVAGQALLASVEVQVEAAPQGRLVVADQQGGARHGGVQPLADMNCFDVAVDDFLRPLFRLLPRQLLFQYVQGSFGEFLQELFILALDDDQARCGIRPEFDRQDRPTARQAVEQLRPFETELLLVIGDELVEAPVGGRVDQLPDLVELLELLDDVEGGEGLDQPAGLGHRDNQVGFLGDQAERIGRGVGPSRGLAAGQQQSRQPRPDGPPEQSHDNPLLSRSLDADK
jgi:hypothetical protein